MLPAKTRSKQLPYDHVVVVVLENHSYSEIVGSPNAIYINDTLIQDGVLITNAYGEQHPSQPNYLWLFSGSNQGVNNDSFYWPNGSPGPVFEAPNLYTALETMFSGTSTSFFGGYIDSGNGTPPAPIPLTKEELYRNNGNYANRHVPWLAFTNIPISVTMDFGTFPWAPGNYDSLPLVSFVIPGLNHDMHDYDNFPADGVKDSNTSAEAIQHGDAWLQAYLDGYAQWAKANNSLLIITFDEDSTSDWPTPVQWGGNGISQNTWGLTAPTLGFNDGTTGIKNWITGDTTSSGPNQIPMILYGANLNCTGPFTVPGVGVNNINLLRTIESFYGLQPSGAQTTLATAAGLSDGPITGCFTF